MAETYFTEGSKFLTTYYGQLSFNEINKGQKFTLEDQSTFSKEFEEKFLKNVLVNHVKLLKELDQTKYSKDIIKHLAEINVNEGSEVLAAKLATSIERYDYAIQISKKASYQKRFYLKYNYPIISTPREINNKIMPNSELVLSIIRQESEFDRKANSYVGARGMMQLMKYTAKTVAKQAKLPYSISRLTSDPEYNIKLGSYYFNSLINNYDGVYPFAIAAYNAGPNRVKTWRRINGDPSKKQLSYIDWIELIRFKETRNYVQRVLENINVYKYMISQKPVNTESFFNK
jgi:soluble lytic murein transglycosylase